MFRRRKPAPGLAAFPESLVRFALIGAESSAPIPRAFRHHITAILAGSFWASYGDELRVAAERLGVAVPQGQRFLAEHMWHEAQRLGRLAPTRRMS